MSIVLTEKFIRAWLPRLGLSLPNGSGPITTPPSRSRV